MKVAVFALNYKNNYSGGRIHALMMAHGFAANGYTVDYYTNLAPVFFDDFNIYPGSENLHLQVSKYFNFPRVNNYDLLLVVPHLASKKSIVFDRFFFYPTVKKFQRASKCQLWFLDFESPNWINKLTPQSRPESAYKYSNKILPSVDAILSTTKEGTKYAEEYYARFNPNLSFKQLYLSINSKVADGFIDTQKRNQVIYFGRFGEKHKNSNVLNDIINALPAGYILLVIGNPAKLNPEIYQALINQAKENSIELVFKSGISESEKYKHLASSKLLIYSSSFEGYGLPPIEAQYVGTPALCSDIPVLREVNKGAEFINFDDKEALTAKINNMLNTNYDKDRLKASVSSFAEFDNYVKNIKYLVDSI